MGDRDPAAAARDHHRALLEQRRGCARSPSTSIGRGLAHHPAPAAARVGRRRPSRAPRPVAAPRLVVERADRLGRGTQRGVLRVDEHAREQHGCGHARVDVARSRSRAGSRSAPGSSRSARRAAAAATSASPSSCCSSSAPTCGPLPCVSSSSWPAARSATISLGDRAARWRAAAPRSPPPRPGSGRCRRWRRRCASQLRTLAPRARSPAPARRSDCATSVGARVAEMDRVAGAELVALAVDRELHRALEHDHELLAGMVHRRRPAVGARLDHRPRRRPSRSRRSGRRGCAGRGPAWTCRPARARRARTTMTSGVAGSSTK